MNNLNIKSRLFLVQIACLICGAIAIFPLAYGALVSFMLPQDIYTKDLILIPTAFSTQNYRIAFSRVDLPIYFLNSLIISLICSVSRVLIGSMAAYALEFFDFRGKYYIKIFLFSSALIPQELIFLQNYVTVSRLGLVNTYLGICSVYLVSALNTFVLCQSFSLYSKTLHGAALLDGCSSCQFFLHILLPTNLTTIIAVFFTSFVSLWNMYLWPLVITNSNQMRTIQVAITMMKGRDSPDFGPVMAAASISVLPAIVLFLFARHYSKDRHIDTKAE